MRATRWSWLVVLGCAVLFGCRAQHYVVLEDQAPLYRDASGDEVVARMPGYHHEALPEDVAAAPGAARIPIVFQGQRGYASSGTVRVFDYLDPALDGGDDRREVVRRELREAQLAQVGHDWSPTALEAVRDGRVTTGMTRPQVELAWGWPQTVERGRLPGAERWVYRERSFQIVRHWVDAPYGFSSFAPGAGYLCGPSLWEPPGHRIGLQGYPSMWTYRTRLPVIEERVVEFDADGRVQRVDARRYIADDRDASSSADTDDDLD